MNIDGVNNEQFRSVMSALGKRGGKRCLETMSDAQRKARATKASKAAAKARRAKKQAVSRGD